MADKNLRQKLQVKGENMETAKIPGSDLVFSRIGLGTWAMGGWMWGGTDENESIRTIISAIDRGVTLIDTAPVYGFGKSEEVVGKALEWAGLRQRVSIATKVGLDWAGGQPFRNATRKRIFAEVEASLARLRTDVIDIYQVHWPDPMTPIEETADAMASLFKQGKIRAIGVSNFSPEQMNEFGLVAPIHSAQPPYNLFRLAEAIHGRGVDQRDSAIDRGEDGADRFIFIGAAPHPATHRPGAEPDARKLKISAGDFRGFHIFLLPDD